jgi:hypothetical protein
MHTGLWPRIGSSCKGAAITMCGEKKPTC